MPGWPTAGGRSNGVALPLSRGATGAFRACSLPLSGGWAGTPGATGVPPPVKQAIGETGRADHPSGRETGPKRDGLRCLLSEGHRPPELEVDSSAWLLVEAEVLRAVIGAMLTRPLTLPAGVSGSDRIATRSPPFARIGPVPATLLGYHAPLPAEAEGCYAADALRVCLHCQNVAEPHGATAGATPARAAPRCPGTPTATQRSGLGHRPCLPLSPPRP